MMAAPHSFQSNDALPLGSSSVYPTYTYPLAVPAQILRQSNPTELGTPDTLNASQSNPWEQNSSSLPRGVSVGDHVAPAASSKDHGHWCWDCDQKSIKLCGDFKRHMQEHENKYWCIPPDSVIYERTDRAAAHSVLPQTQTQNTSTHSIASLKSAEAKVIQGSQLSPSTSPRSITASTRNLW